MFMSINRHVCVWWCVNMCIHPFAVECIWIDTNKHLSRMGYVCACLWTQCVWVCVSVYQCVCMWYTCIYTLLSARDYHHKKSGACWLVRDSLKRGMESFVSVEKPWGKLCFSKLPPAPPSGLLTGPIIVAVGARGTQQGCSYPSNRRKSHCLPACLLMCKSPHHPSSEAVIESSDLKKHA